MDKKTLETFIKKYHLNGLVDEVRWIVKDKTLRVTAMTGDKKFMVSITQKKFDALDKDTEIGIMDSPKLKVLLAGTADNVALSLIPNDNDPERVKALVITDVDSEIVHTCGDLDVIRPTPSIKQVPNYDVEIPITEVFLEKFSKYATALKESELVTLLMDKKRKKLEMVLGEGRNITNRVSMQINPVAGKDTVRSPISFTANHFKELLAANTEVKDPVLKVSEAGLAFIEFDTPEFQSQYYMIKVDIDD